MTNRVVADPFAYPLKQRYGLLLSIASITPCLDVLVGLYAGLKNISIITQILSKFQ
jgi:hypothetical protein